MQLIAILRDEVLSIVGAVKVLSVRVFSGTSVVAADDEVRRAVVFPDDGMPHSLPRPRHAHRKRKKGEVRHAVGILGHDRLVDADSGVVVDVARLGEANDRVDEEICLVLPCGTESQLTVRAVHGVARLERDDRPPCELFELRAELRGSDC